MPADLPGWDWLFVLGLLVLAPLTLIVRRRIAEVRREEIKGWNGSGDRIAEILDEARREGGPEAESGAEVY